MKKIIGSLLFFIVLFLSASEVFSADERFWRNFIVPSQTFNAPKSTYVFVSTNPLSPTLIIATNTNRSGITITNVSTLTISNYEGIWIYIGTSAATTGWDRTLVNQGQGDVNFSSNSRPIPLVNTFVLVNQSTVPILSNGFGSTQVSSNAVVNPGYNGYDLPPYVKGNSFFMPGPDMVTYVGPWYAVAVGTVGANNSNLAGKVKVTEIEP